MVDSCCLHYTSVFHTLFTSCSCILSGRYLFLNAIANQLRFPNSHTHYFSCALLSLFADAHSVALQEQITRLVHQYAVTRQVNRQLHMSLYPPVSTEPSAVGLRSLHGRLVVVRSAAILIYCSQHTS